MFRLGYNTNGLAHHRVVDALRLLAELGYEGIAITPDVGQLDPYHLDRTAVADARDWARDLGLSVAIETGARYLLDARRKHFPTLLEDGADERGRRVDFLRRCIDLAVELDAGVVSLWAGVAPTGVAGEEPWDRLCDGVRRVLAHARESGVVIGFEPEPGMFVERPAGYFELCERLGADGDELGLCLDVGHLLCTGDLPVGDVIARCADRLVQVHLDDVAQGVHEHLMFGNGDLDLREALNALLEAGYDGMAAVELSRDSHRGAEAAEVALRHLREAFTKRSEPA